MYCINGYIFNKYKFQEKSELRKVHFVIDIFRILKLPFVNLYNINSVNGIYFLNR